MALRYAARPAFSEVQLSLLEDDVVELELKSPTASGQRVVPSSPGPVSPSPGLAHPASKQNQVRYYGVFAPTHALRAEVVPKPVELEVVQDDEGLAGARRGRVRDLLAPWRRTIEAGARRVRPCLMTTAITFVALLPVVTSTGRGADLMRRMAVPILGGMAVELSTLFVVPVLYAVMEIRRLDFPRS